MAQIIDEKDMHPKFGNVPASKGVPATVLIITVLGIVAIYIIGASVIKYSSYGHSWPAANTQRVDLSK